MDSITRIMKRHSVSRETAKRVLKNLVDENLAISRAGKGTYANYVNDIKSVWGMVVPFYSSNIEQLISQVDVEASDNGRKLQYFLHYNNPEEEIRIVGNLIQEGYESIIIVPNYDESLTASFYRNLSPGKTKIILADNTMAGSYFNYVIQSYDLGVKRAVDYLGHKTEGNFLLLGTERWQGKNLVFDSMQQTFTIVTQTLYPGRQLYVAAGMNELSAEYFRSNTITGVLSIQDSNSIRLIGRLREWGFRVPENISVVSYGNTEITKFFRPPITAIDCNYTEMAKNIGKLVFLTRSEGKNQQIVVQPKLIERET